MKSDNSKAAMLGLLAAVYGEADESLLERTIAEIESAKIPSTTGWAALVPFAVAKAWDKLDITSKMVAYVIAIDREADVRF